MVIEIFFLIIIVFIVQYFIMSWIETNSNSDITNNLNKMYLSTISGLFVGILYILLFDFKQSTLSTTYYIGFGVGIGLLTYAYRNQLGVTNYDWVNTMIEKISGELLITKSIGTNSSGQSDKPNPDNLAVGMLSDWMVKNQKEQINILKKISSQMVPRGVFY